MSKIAHKSHHALLPLGGARHGVEVGKAVPEESGFEGANVGGGHAEKAITFLGSVSCFAGAGLIE
jgi:hypothetical protein